MKFLDFHIAHWVLALVKICWILSSSLHLSCLPSTYYLRRWVGRMDRRTNMVPLDKRKRQYLLLDVTVALVTLWSSIILKILMTTIYRYLSQVATFHVEIHKVILFVRASAQTSLDRISLYSVQKSFTNNAIHIL